MIFIVNWYTLIIMYYNDTKFYSIIVDFGYSLWTFFDEFPAMKMHTTGKWRTLNSMLKSPHMSYSWFFMIMLFSLN